LNQQFPDLQNLAFLGRGGQKIVLSALHPTLGHVVLKLFPSASDPETIRRELLAITEVGAPLVPTVYEAGTRSSQLGDLVWVLEQRVMGDCLRQLLGNGPLSPLEVLRLGLDTLETLTLAERAAIVHRDVKPDNIMRSTDGRYWLLDFGIARHLRLSSMTGTAAPFGKFTLGYAPREQCRNIKTEIDSRADLFALGVTLIEAGTGTHPILYPPATPMQQLGRVGTVAIPPLMLSIEQADSLRDLVAAMTQSRRDHRPRTAGEALAWLVEISRANGLHD
jgi:serine/threonine-protein kinase